MYRGWSYLPFACLIGLSLQLEVGGSSLLPVHFWDEMPDKRGFLGFARLGKVAVVMSCVALYLSVRSV